MKVIDGETSEIKMIDQFLCPGCTSGCGPAIGCPTLDVSKEYGTECKGHSAGTFIVGVGRIFLGLPKGFNRGEDLGVRLWSKDTSPDWDHLNVPVWAMEEDGHLFVRTYSPRINKTYVDIIEEGSREELCPKAINVAEFHGDID